MSKKTIYLFYIFIGLFSLITIQAIYINNTKTVTNETLNKKLQFVKFVGLPDLAISTEATYIRHRSLSDIFSIYKDDGTLREYFPTTYAISHSGIINNSNQKINK